MSNISIRLRTRLAKLKDADDDGHESQDRGDDAEDDGAGRVGVRLSDSRGCGRAHCRVKLEGSVGIDCGHDRERKC